VSLLDVAGVSKSFGALKAVDDVSFSVERGAMFGIAGPNGSGKSTLFNVITGIPYGADGGSILFDGAELVGHPAHAIARMGLVRTFQKDAEFPTLSAFDNVLLGAVYLSGIPEATARQRVIEVAGLVGFDRAKLPVPAGTLSVYEKKLLMLASALVGEPRALLLDEPASGLTKPEVTAFDEILRRVNGEGVTILLIEHILPLLLSISQELMVLNYGRVIAAGDPHGVMRDPAVVDAYLGGRAAA